MFKQDKQCGFCCLPIPDFKGAGAFGCANCYTAFSDLLNAQTQQCQKGSVHRGRAPVSWLKKRIIESDLRKIEKDYIRCLAEQNYEKADYLKKMMYKLRVAILP
ncbi:MAG TPA: hypothetical protein VLH40_08235 [Atribacteraceae bacterium]|nr:hypothetical protein [Atribacteraceae bacterium]